MDFRIADTFTAALARLTHDEQKAVKMSVFDLQTNMTGQGLQLHRIEASKDPNFWSARVNRDIRIIVHRTTSKSASRLRRSSRRCLQMGRTPPHRGPPQNRRGPNRRGP